MENTFETEHLCNIIDDHYDTIQAELDMHKTRWARSATTQKDVSDMKRFAKNRQDIFLNQLKKYFPEQFE